MNRRLAPLIVGLIALAACGGSSGTGEQASGGGQAASPLPAIVVQDVTADRPVALDSFVPSDRPTLLWFWAPH